MKIKEIEIDGKVVRFAASASIPRIYRNKFNRDIIVDMRTIQNDMELHGKSGDNDESYIPFNTLNLFEDIAYIMARHADPTISENVYDWLDEFETFSIYKVLPELIALWKENNLTMSIPKKK